MARRQQNDDLREEQEEIPRDVEAEDAVLGAILLENCPVRRIDDLDEGLFYDPRNALVCRACKSIRERGGDDAKIDVHTVSSELRAMDRLNAAGGAQHLGDLSDSIPTAAHFDAHLNILKSVRAAREIAYKARTWTKLAPRSSLDPHSLLDLILSDTEQVRAGAVQRKSWPLVQVTQAYANALERIERQASFDITKRPAKTGLHGLDKIIKGFSEKEFIILAGRPGQGKSSVGLSMASNIARAEYAAATAINAAPRAVLYVSQEMPNTDLALRQACADGGMNLAKLKEGALSEQDFQGLYSSANTFPEDTPFYFYDIGNASVGSIREIVLYLKLKHGNVLGVFVDYLQILKPDRDRRYNSKSDEVGAISNGLLSLTKELGCFIVAMSQLNRECEKRPSRVPELSDMRGAGEVEQDADMVLAIMRPELYAHQVKEYDKEEYRNIGEVYVLKQRNGPVGDKVKLRFRKESASFHDMPEDIPQEDRGERDVLGTVAQIEAAYTTADTVPSYEEEGSLVDDYTL